MTDESSPTSGFQRFWTSVPGVLTAVAAVITALGGIYLASNVSSSPGPNSPPSPPEMVVVNLRGDPAEAPSVSGQITAGQLAVNRIGSESSSADAGAETLIDECASGNADACTQVLVGLINECDAGYGISCDSLYLVSPQGSAYQLFGATCGGRLSVEYAARCEDV